jgi:hypothetical protein
MKAFKENAESGRMNKNKITLSEWVPNFKDHWHYNLSCSKMWVQRETSKHTNHFKGLIIRVPKMREVISIQDKLYWRITFNLGATFYDGEL